MPSSALFQALDKSLAAVNADRILAVPFLDVCRLVLPVIGTCEGSACRCRPPSQAY
jgi:hypothetical protein